MLTWGISYNVTYVCRMVIEADYIGILLLGAAGFNPQWTHVVMDKSAEFERRTLSHPSPKKRLQFLSEAKTMKEALELYREAVTAMNKVTDRYFRYHISSSPSPTFPNVNIA